MSRRSASGALEAATEIFPWRARIFQHFIRHAKCYHVLLQGGVSLKFLIMEFYSNAAMFGGALSRIHSTQASRADCVPISVSVTDTRTLHWEFFRSIASSVWTSCCESLDVETVGSGRGARTKRFSPMWMGAVVYWCIDRFSRSRQCSE